MSHTLDDEQDPSEGALQQQQRLSRMMKQGRSWSGHERNCCFLNIGGTRFATVSAVSGLDFDDDARALAPVDWDGDGDLDVWISNRNAPRLRLMRNEDRSENRFVALFLVDGVSRANKDAIGARVEVTASGGSTRWIKTLRAGEGFLSQGSKWLHFGLGSAEGVGRVTVRWPGGSEERFEGVEPGQRYRLVRGAGRAESWRREGDAVELEAGEQEVPPQPSAARIPMVTLLPVPKLSYATFDGGMTALPIAQGRPVLINLWASWCAPCVAELSEFGAKRSEFDASGVAVLALSVDGLGEGKGSPAKAEALLKRLRFPFPSGRATETLVSVMQHLHDTLTPTERPLPVPSSFLIDAGGRLSVLYKGPVSVETVLSDLAHSGRNRSERLLASTPLGGSVIEHPSIAASADVAEATTRFQFARDVAEAGRLEDALVHYREVIRLIPDFAEAHNNLGLVYSGLGNWTEAVTHLEQAVRSRPELAEGYFNLGTVHQKQGDLDRAIARYRAALEFRPNYPRAHNAIGILLARLNRLDEAMAEFREEIRLFPMFAETHNNLGLACLQREDAVGSLEHFANALRLDDAYADAENNSGIACRRLGENDRARRHYENAIRLQPDFVEARNNLGLLLMAEGKLAEARVHFEQALRTQPDFASARQNLARVRALLGQAPR